MVAHHRTRKIKQHRKTRHRGGSKTSSNKKTIEIPLLSKIKNLDDWEKTYLKQVLVSLHHKTTFHQIENILKKEIHNLEITGKSGKFTFPKAEVKRIVPHLKHYIDYFKYIDENGYINIDVILALRK